MRQVKLLTIVFFLLLIWIPIVQGLFQPLPEVSLKGKVRKAPKVSFSSEHFLSGSLQPGVERLALHKSGLMGYLTKTDNQLNYSVFGQLNNKYRTGTVLGRNGTVFKRAELKHYNRLSSVPNGQLERLARELALFQDFLKQRGKAFILLISPNRLSIYPEIVPASFMIASKRAQPSNYSRLLPFLERENVEHFDAISFLKQRKESSRYSYFGKAGYHYNEYAACVIGAELVSRLERQVGKPLRLFECDPPLQASQPTAADKELFRIANLWSFDQIARTSPIPRHQRIERKGEVQPRAFFEGTSFLWGLFEALDRHQVFQHRDFFFYFNAHETYPPSRRTKVDRTNVAWERNVLSNDVFIIEIYAGSIHKAGHSMVRRALQKFEPIRYAALGGGGKGRKRKRKIKSQELKSRLKVKG